MAEMEWKRGPEVAWSARRKRIRARVRWAVRESGLLLPKIRFVILDGILWRHPATKPYRWRSLCGLSRAGVGAAHTNHGTVYVNHRKPHGFADTLIHETAHVITGRVETLKHPHDHSDLWGLVYGRIYRAYFDRADGPKLTAPTKS